MALSTMATLASFVVVILPLAMGACTDNFRCGSWTAADCKYPGVPQLCGCLCAGGGAKSPPPRKLLPSPPPPAPASPSPPKPPLPPPATGPFTLPPLRYAYNALEPAIDNLTMTIHHDRHHQAYVSNLNAALGPYPDLQAKTLLQLNQLVGTDGLPAPIATAVRNNGGGHWNHAFFWKILAPAGTTSLSSELSSAIDATFGSLTDFKTKFAAAAAARFGSGWAWLALAPNGTLIITSTPNQDNPLQPVADARGIPVLAVDVWEHAYYLKYQNVRASYVAAFWNVTNWTQASQNFAAAKQGTVLDVGGK